MHSFFFPTIEGSHQLRDPSHPWHLVYNSGLNYTYGPWHNHYRVYTSKSVFPGEWYLFSQMGEFQLESPHDFSITRSTILLDVFLCSWWWPNWRRKHFFEKEKQLKKLRVTLRNLGVTVLTPRTPFNENEMFSFAARCYSFSSSQVGALLGKIPVSCWSKIPIGLMSYCMFTIIYLHLP